MTATAMVLAVSMAKLDTGLKVTNNLLPHLAPFASTFASSLDGLLKKADKFTQSAGFKKFLDQFQKIEGPSVTAIGDGIGKVANSIGKLMTTMSGKDDARAIGIAFNTIAGAISIVSGIVAKLMSNWDGMSGAAKRDTHEVAQSFDALRGDIVNALSGAGSWLVHAGEAVMDGFLHGVESGFDHVKSFIGGIGSWIAAHKGPVEYDRTLLVPAGTAIMDGLLKGISAGTVKVKAKVTSISSTIVTSLQGGQAAITAAAKAAGNAAAGPDATINTAITKLKADVSGDTGLTKWLTAQNKKLQGLAAQRQQLESEITDSQQIAQAALSNSSIMNASGYTPAMAAGPTDVSSTIMGMQAMAADQKAFAQQIKQLQGMGLNSTSLNQIVQSGVTSGLPVAEGLTSGGKSGIKQVNALQSQIQGSAAQIGDAGAKAMFQAGVDAGKGLAQGIKSQLSAVTSAISSLANQLVAQIKADLKIKSPSLVAREIGQNFGGGLSLGMTDRLGMVASSSHQLAGAMAGGVGGGRGGVSGGGDTYIFNLSGIVGDRQQLGQHLHQVLREHKRGLGGASLRL